MSQHPSDTSRLYHNTQPRNFALESNSKWKPPAYSDRIEFDPVYVGTRSVNKQADFIQRKGTPVASWKDVPGKAPLEPAMFFNPRSTDVLTR